MSYNLEVYDADLIENPFARSGALVGVSRLGELGHTCCVHLSPDELCAYEIGSSNF